MTAGTFLQMQKHGSVHAGQVWFFPKASFWHKPIPGINLEILGLDLNFVNDVGGACQVYSHLSLISLP
jgi:hypothetical protein